MGEGKEKINHLADKRHRVRLPETLRSAEFVRDDPLLAIAAFFGAAHW
jgi:hypothetical protein